MTVSTSLLAYQDCTAIMDQALADEKGARYKVSDVDEASHQRMRIHYARKLHRDENAKTYEPGHPMHGRSEYDALTCRIKNVDGSIYIYLERTDTVQTEVEPLSGIAAEPPAFPAYTAVRQIEHKPEAVEQVVQNIVNRRV